MPVPSRRISHDPRKLAQAAQQGLATRHQPPSVDTESGSGALFLMEREKMHPFGRAVKSLPMRRRGLLFALISRAFGK
jgi:hypothetical protein